MSNTKSPKKNSLLIVFGIVAVIIITLITGILTIKPYFNISVTDVKNESSSQISFGNNSEIPELILSEIENCGSGKLKFNQTLFKPNLSYRNLAPNSGRVLEYVEFKPIEKNKYESFAVYCRVYKNVDTEIQSLKDIRTQLPKIESSILTEQKFGFVTENSKIKNQVSYPASEYIKKDNELSVVASTSEANGNILRSDKIYEIITQDGISYHIGVLANNLAPELKLDKSILELSID